MADDFTIVCDTREQKPYTFKKIETVSEAMETGDYSVKGFEDIFAIERKTLADFLKSITWDRDRFKREIIRADALTGFLVVIKAPKTQITDWNYDRDVHPNSVMGTIKKWEEYHNVKFVWGGDREAAEEFTLKKLQTWYTAYKKMQS